MKKIFIDTNILLDVAMHRNDFLEHSAAVWADCESRRVQGYVSAISLNNMHYVLKKHVDPSSGTMEKMFRTSRTSSSAVAGSTCFFST